MLTMHIRFPWDKDWKKVELIKKLRELTDIGGLKEAKAFVELFEVGDRPSDKYVTSGYITITDPWWVSTLNGNLNEIRDLGAQVITEGSNRSPDQAESDLDDKVRELAKEAIDFDNFELTRHLINYLEHL